MLMAQSFNCAKTKKTKETKTVTSQELLTKLRADIKSGMTNIPSTRQLAMLYGLHRNTCAKILQRLKSENLIDMKGGRSYSRVNAVIDPVDTAIDYLLNQGMSLSDAKNLVLAKFAERQTLTVVSPNKALIIHELSNQFPLSETGLRVSDKPKDGSFLLQLSDLKQFDFDVIKPIPLIGIVSKSADFRSHVEGCLNKETIHSNGETVSTKTVLQMSRVVLCDRKIESALRNFAVNLRQVSDCRCQKIIPVPYLHENVTKELKQKCWT